MDSRIHSSGRSRLAESIAADRARGNLPSVLRVRMSSSPLGAAVTIRTWRWTLLQWREILLNTPRTILRVVIGVVGILTVGLGFIYWYDKTGQRPDPRFNSSVAHPTYLGNVGPRIAFDVAHNNWHTPTGRYRPLADLLRHDGYRAAEHTSEFTAASLDSVQILVVANALGPDGHESRAAFTETEDTALVTWVQHGGALLLIADHVPFGSAAEQLASRFGVTMYLAFARDDKNHSGWDNERLLFSRANGLLTACPITDGRTSAERIENVVTFTGQSLSVPPGAIPILRMDDDAYDWESRSVRHSARGHAQAIAMTFGKGKLVMLGEAGLLSAQVDPLGFRMGMNSPGNDDRQFALNVMHWLSGALK
jgi:hypothetical protein